MIRLITASLITASLIAASAAHALETAQITGNWACDTELTWAEMAKTPEMKAQIAQNPGIEGMMKGMVLPMLAKVTSSIAGDVITSSKPDGTVKSFTIKTWTSTGANTATCVTTDPDGKDESAQIELTAEGLLRVTMHDGRETMTVVSRRAK